MIVERTHDMRLVSEIMHHPAIWPHIHDDGVKEYQPVDLDELYWLKVVDDETIGAFLVHPNNSVCYEVHTCILPDAWGNKAKKASQLLLKWVFENTVCMKLVTHVPAYNKLAKRFAKNAGMKEEGINRQSFLRNGELLDQYLLGITKQEWLCQQQSL